MRKAITLLKKFNNFHGCKLVVDTKNIMQAFLGRLKLINIQFRLNIFSSYKEKNIVIVALRRGFLMQYDGKR